MAKSEKLQISEFDIELFRKLTQRYLSTNMLLELLPTFGAKAKIRKKASLQDRLKRLYDEGYINRDQRLSRGQGVNEYYYFLTKKGAAFFEELENAKPGKGILRRLEMGSQEHAFMVAEVLVKMEKDIFNIRHIARILGFIRENYFEIAIPAARKMACMKATPRRHLSGFGRERKEAARGRAVRRSGRGSRRTGRGGAGRGDCRRPG